MFGDKTERIPTDIIVVLENGTPQYQFRVTDEFMIEESAVYANQKFLAEIVILMIRRRERKVGFIGQISFVLKNLKRINSSNVTINILCTYFGSIVDDRMPERASGRRYFR